MWAFEVSFNGVLMFSKLLHKVWPNYMAVAKRCAAIAEAADKGEDIMAYQTRPPVVEEVDDRLTQVQGQIDSMTNKTGPQSRAGTRPGRQAGYASKGRKISTEECKFIFDRIWKATLETDKENADAKDVPEDQVHPKERESNIVMIDDIFHVIDLAAKLLNKDDPKDTDTKPFDEFMKHASTQLVTDKDG